MMNAILSGFSEVIAFLLQSFRLAFVAPSFIYLALNAYFILPALPPTAYSKQFMGLKSVDQLLLIGGASFLLGYFLTILNLWIIRLFEGYHWRDTKPGKYLIARNQAEKQWWMDLLLERVRKVLSMQDLPMRDPRRQQSADELEEIQSVIEPLVNRNLQESYRAMQESGPQHADVGICVRPPYRLDTKLPNHQRSFQAHLQGNVDASISYSFNCSRVFTTFRPSSLSSGPRVECAEICTQG